MMIALYLRLSESDGDLGADGKNESNSIDNQRELLRQYVTNNADWRGCEIIEYVDDGYTGTNFKRPGFQKMIEDAKKGMINTIIVKDLSRLGRDYIMAGDYIEQIFPLLGVRFIAVNSNYDSKSHEGEAMSFDAAVSNLINTLYSRDLSKKLKSANQAKWNSGVSTSGMAPFGYVIDKEHKGKWKVDPEAAAIVREIFDLAVQGKGTREIATVLNEEKKPCPSVYNETHRNWTLTEFKTASAERLWDSNKVLIILRRYDYTGAMVMGRRKSIVIGSNIRRTQPNEKRTVVEGVNEAIVSHEIYEKAQLSIHPRKKPAPSKEYKFPLKGKLRCGTCRLMMKYDANSGTDKVFCEHAMKTGKHAACCKDQYSMKHIESVVLEAINVIIGTLLYVGDRGEKKTRSNMETAKAVVANFDSEIEKLTHEKVVLYERYADELLSKDTYLRKREELNSRIEGLKKQREESEQYVEGQDALRECAVRMTDISGRFSGAKKLTREMVLAFVQDVYVYDQEHIEVVFNFEDEIKLLMKQIDGKDKTCA